MQSSVASDLTEKIRECLKNKMSKFSSCDDEGLGDEYAGITTSVTELNEKESSFLGLPPSKRFQAHFVTKGQKERDR